MRHIFKQPPKLARSRKLGYIAWRARDEAARLAVPPPPEPQPGQCVQEWLFSGPGWAHGVRLLTPADTGRRRPRSDQYAVEIDGQRIAERMSVTDALRLVQARYLPQQMTRAQRREAEAWGYTARDEADAAAAQMAE